MNLIYLDQNTLTDLRSQKLANIQDKAMINLRKVLENRSTTFRVIYSNTHLDEIRQIGNPKYINEHINMLAELKSLYLNKESNIITDSHPLNIWNEYINNENDNERLGISKVISVQDAITRKIHGLPVREDFDELQDILSKSMKSMLAKCKVIVSELVNDKTIDSKDSASIQNYIEGLSISAENLPTLGIDPCQELGPMPLRGLPEVRSIGLESIDSRDVIQVIKNIFTKENTDFKWENLLPNTVNNQIAHCYSLMNLFGYFPDDFTRVKKGKDRFRASMKDLQHVQQAAGSAYLISRDRAFLKKADACYKHLKINTKVMDPEHFINSPN